MTTGPRKSCTSPAITAKPPWNITAIEEIVLKATKIQKITCMKAGVMNLRNAR